jgi:hypothetical protein
MDEPSEQPSPPRPQTPPPSQAVPPPLTGYAVPGSWGGPAWRSSLQVPGSVTAAAVLTYISAGLAILASLFLLVLSSVMSEIPDSGFTGPVLLVTVVLGIGIGVLYVVAAVMLQRGRSRVFLLWLTVATIVINVVGVIVSFGRMASGGPPGGSGLCSIILPVVILILLLQPSTKEWIDAHRAPPWQPPT